MGERQLHVSVDFLVECLKEHGSVPRTFTVIENAIPDDATVVQMGVNVATFGSPILVLTLRSTAWEEIKSTASLPSPLLHVDYGDESG